MNPRAKVRNNALSAVLAQFLSTKDYNKAIDDINKITGVRCLDPRKCPVTNEELDLLDTEEAY